MRDRNDKSTDDLLRTPAARRQAAYADRQRALGRCQRAIWMTEPEYLATQELLDRLRGSQADL